MENTQNWKIYKEFLFNYSGPGLMLDLSKVRFPADFFDRMEPLMQGVYAHIDALEKGSTANPDEGRMVGHYWLRNPGIAPDETIAGQINAMIANVTAFAAQIHEGKLTGQSGKSFRNALVIGIGGSSLGPKLVAEALSTPHDKMRLFFIDNTDPDGIDRVLAALAGQLDQTLTIVISKSGGTIETRNGMEEIRRSYQQNGLDFAQHAVSITQPGSLLSRVSAEERWLDAFPMWDWVGGRTSVFSAVGLLPLALQGIDIVRLLAGAKACDELTRLHSTRQNPAALLALSWYAITQGQGGQTMVVLPYKDRLELLTKYLQQLIMESLGKRYDLEHKEVCQGIAVLGNKGSTDQHSYLQQLLDGPANIFITFIEVLKDRQGQSARIAEESTSGDYLHAFLLGTRKALTSRGRDSITVTIRQVDEYAIAALLALFERTVSMYANLVNINAYHQPAVELGKKGAGEIIALKNRAVAFLRENSGQSYTVEEIASGLADRDIDIESLFKTLIHLAHNPDHGVMAEAVNDDIFRQRFSSAFTGFSPNKMS